MFADNDDIEKFMVYKNSSKTKHFNSVQLLVKEITNDKIYIG